MTDKQPEALRLAEHMEISVSHAAAVREKAAAELRRLDALNAELVEALEKLARLGNGDSYGNSIGNDIAIAALAKAEGK